MAAQPSPEPLYVLRGHRAAVQSVAFLPSCKALAAGDAEGELKLWDLDSQRPTASIRAHDSTSGILHISCPASHPRVISQGRDGIVKCWDVHSGSSLSSDPVHELSTGCFNFCRFALLEPGQTCSSCCTKSQQQHQPSTATAQLRVDGFPMEGPDAEGDPSRSSRWQQAAPDGLLSQQLKQQQHSQEAVPHALTQPQHPQQQRFEDGTAAVQLESLTLQQPEAHGSQGASHAYAAPANTTAAAVGAGGAGDLTEEAEEQLMCRAAAGCDSHSSSCGGAAASTSCTNRASAAGPCYLALPAGDPAHLGLWQLGTAGGGSQGSGVPQVLLAQRKGAQQPHRGQCMAVVLLQPAGLPLHALTGYEDGSVALWDTRNPSTYLAAQKLHSEPVMCLAAAPDCSSGFSGSADDVLAAFDVDVPKGQLRAGPQLRLPQQGLADVGTRPDGRVAATAGWDCKVRVWHARRRQPLAILKWHSQQVACVGFSSDSVLMAAGGRDNIISMWSLYPPS